MIKAWCLGVIDGWNQPWDLTCGITWSIAGKKRDPRDNIYGRGANFGQWLGQRFNRNAQ